MPLYAYNLQPCTQLVSTNPYVNVIMYNKIGTNNYENNNNRRNTRRRLYLRILHEKKTYLIKKNRLQFFLFRQTFICMMHNKDISRISRARPHKTTSVSQI